MQRSLLLCRLLGAAGLLWGMPWSAAPANASPAPNLATASYLEFDVPGSACFGRHPVCTAPVSVNAFGAVTGFYSDNSGASHGFVRSPRGVFTEFTVPGVTCGQFSDCTIPAGINFFGLVVGTATYFNGNFNIEEGFLRTPDGNITVFQGPGAVFTQATGINAAGVIVGTTATLDASHAFLRAPDGTLTLFDVPGGRATSPTAINLFGVVTGTFQDASGGPATGFVRGRNGQIATFSGQPSSISLDGTVAGSSAGQGFLRKPDGTITLFNVPGATQTLDAFISPTGLVAGSDSENPGGGDPNFGPIRGYIRSRDGSFTLFDPPGSSQTYVTGINAWGVVTGYYFDVHGSHGFLRIPCNPWWGPACQ